MFIYRKSINWPIPYDFVRLLQLIILMLLHDDVNMRDLVVILNYAKSRIQSSRIQI